MSLNRDNAEKWRWKLRAFFSADVIGSTAYKSSNSGSRGDPQWASTFTEFYREFPVAVAHGYQSVPQGCLSALERVTPWKFSGDEILFHVELKDFRHVATHLAAFKRAVTDYSDLWSQKGVALSLKPTGWLAGFPVTNREVSVTAASDLDFIGPSVDLGFRLSKFATRRKFVLSADLTLMLLDAVHACDIHWQDFHVFMHGREELKGVLGGVPYPIFWLDTTDGRPDPEEELLGSGRPFIPHKARQFLRSFLEKTPSTRRPFIDGDTDPRYGTIPVDLQKVRDEMRSEEESRQYDEEVKDAPTTQGADLAAPELPPPAWS